VYAKECLFWQDDFSVLPDLVVGDITIITDDVFKPSAKKEQSLFHSTTNKLHITTGKDVIEGQLLFKKGDLFQLDKLEESERLLRKNRYIKDARITPTQLCNNAVTIQVQTQDHWTLTPGFSLGSSGGESRSGLSLQEHNLFGLGKSLSLKYNRNSERNSTLLAYKDPQLFGSRKQLFASIQDNSDGKGYALDLNLPFYAIDSQSSWGIKTSSLKQKNSFYHQGNVIKKIGTKNINHAAFYGWTNNKSNMRFKVGWTYNKHSYFPTQTDNHSTASVIESYPWFEFEQYKQRYIKKTNFKSMDKTEDIAIGHNLTANIGLLSRI
jgi:outer membrane protein assembly factor BamA